MKLSEAIILGSMIRPKATYKYCAEEGSCALGAALEAMGKLSPGTYRNLDSSVPATLWPYGLKIVHHPDPLPRGVTEGPLFSVIEWLNFRTEWTRERIADWVANIESQAVQHPKESIHGVKALGMAM